MAKVKVNIGTPASPNLVVTDLKNVDTVDNIHFRVNAGKLEYSTDGTTWNVI